MHISKSTSISVKSHRDGSPITFSDSLVCTLSQWAGELSIKTKRYDCSFPNLRNNLFCGEWFRHKFLFFIYFKTVLFKAAEEHSMFFRIKRKHFDWLWTRRDIVHLCCCCKDVGFRKIHQTPFYMEETCVLMIKPTTRSRRSHCCLRSQSPTLLVKKMTSHPTVNRFRAVKRSYPFVRCYRGLC